MQFKLLGFKFGKDPSITLEAPKEEKAFAPPQNEDGAVTITASPHYGTYVDLEGHTKNEVELLTKYRELSIQPELSMAIDDIVNDAIVKNEEGDIVDLLLDDVKSIRADTKKKITEEWNNVLKLLNWSNIADDIFKRWYVDGRIIYHIIVNEAATSEGIKELRYIDPRRIHKMREIERERDPKTGADIVKRINEYYVYSEKINPSQIISNSLGVKIAPDAIVQTNSGLIDSKGQMVLSYLHEAIKTFNNLRMVEDAIVINRLARAPMRRVFYIDVGNMGRQKAEQYLYDIMIKYRNKMVYDASTGEVRDDRKHMSMLEDFWIPRRGEGKSTEITTLQQDANLDKIEDVDYFKKKLANSLHVPYSRLNPEQASQSIVGIGRSTEVTREELRFARFINKIRNKFSFLLIDLLGKQLKLKNICNDEEWKEIRENLALRWFKNNNFEELLEMELIKERLGVLALADPFVGRYYSGEWVKRKILQMNDEEIEEIKKQIKGEQTEGDPAVINNPAMAQMGQGVAGQVPDQGPGGDQGGAPGQPGGQITDPSIPGAPTFDNAPMDNTGVNDAVGEDDAAYFEDKTKQKENAAKISPNFKKRLSEPLV
jgi:hypothetical protein